MLQLQRSQYKLRGPLALCSSESARDHQLSLLLVCLHSCGSEKGYYALSDSISGVAAGRWLQIQATVNWMSLLTNFINKTVYQLPLEFSHCTLLNSFCTFHASWNNRVGKKPANCHLLVSKLNECFDNYTEIQITGRSWTSDDQSILCTRIVCSCLTSAVKYADNIIFTIGIYRPIENWPVSRLQIS